MQTNIPSAMVRADRSLHNDLSSWKRIKSIATSPMTVAALQFSKRFAEFDSRHVDPHVTDIVDLCICIASTIGSLSIIIPYIVNRRSRKLRHALILGLATSDLVSSLIITATTSYSLAGGDLTDATKFCTFAGYIFAASLWTEHLWNVSIAVITYMILVHPLSTFVHNVERHLIWLWPLYWAIGLIGQGIAWARVGFVNVDGYCTYNPKHGQYFAPIFQFIPRSLVVLTILVLYTHLFFFLRRTNLFSAAASHGDSRKRVSQVASKDYGLGTLGVASMRTANADADLPRAASSSGMPRSASIQRTASAIISKMKRTQSSSSKNAIEALCSSTPMDQTSSSSSKRNGSASTQGKASSTSGAPVSLLNCVQPMDYSMASVSPKYQALDENALQRQQAEEPATAESSEGTTALPTEDSNEISQGNVKDDIDDEDDEELFRPMHARRDVGDFRMTSPPQEHLRHLSLSPTAIKKAKRATNAEEFKDFIEAPESAADPSGVTKNAPAAGPTFEEMCSPDWQWGMSVQNAKKPTTHATKSSRQPWRLSFAASAKRSRDHVGTSSTGSSSNNETSGVDATGSTLNRQASVLLLLYPAVYVLLFGVSIIRIIIDFSKTPAQLDPLRNYDALHSVSRWTIFAQGAIDAIIFQVIERQFRLRMKRRRKIAAGEKVDDACWKQMMNLAKRGLNKLRPERKDASGGEKHMDVEAAATTKV